MSQTLSSLKQRPETVRAAWLVGKALNHYAPRLLSEIAGTDERPIDCVRPPPQPANASTGIERFDPGELSRGGYTAYHPVMTAEDVTDFGDVDFVADPFLYPDGERWHMFFEVFNGDREPDAVIAHATSRNGFDWEYHGVVLETEKHLSFPYVFEWEGQQYMVPETGGAEDQMVELYEAVDFPNEWRRCAVPVSREHGTDDAIVFRRDDAWWILVGDDTIDGTHLYWSDTLCRDDWEPHPENPIIVDRPTAARPAGRPVVTDDQVVVFYQDCKNQYGERVRAYELTSLDRESFSDHELSASPVFEGTGAHLGWNAGRMHHVDPWHVDGRWFCAVDGNVNYPNVFTNEHWSIGVHVSAKR